MVTYADVRRWDPAGLAAASTDLKSDLKTLEKANDELETQAVPDSFLGLAAFSARALQSTLVSRMSTHVEQATSFEKAIYSARARVAVLKRDVESIDSDARANEFEIGGDGTVTDASTPLEFTSIPAAEAHMDQRVTLRDALVERVERALERANEIDQELLWAVPRESFSDGEDEVDDPAGGEHERLDGPVDLSDDAFDLSQINQGDIGDCWLLASAASVGANDPDFIRDHIRHNPDGSYTVTLYEDGRPVDIRVDASTIPYGVTGRDDQPTWLSIYEKAAASHMGGDYDDIAFDRVSRGFEMVTGRDTDGDEDRGLDDIRRDLDAGRSLVVSTEDDSKAGWNPFDTAVDDDNVVPNHAYVIESVIERDGETIIRLVNPWGPDGGTASDGHFKDGVLELTEAEFHQNFDETTSLPRKKR
ncbi:C2 family cysteine protease [Nocardioides sp.]|uniref:C2 family cysteine protease n=1 Tax=Nocardioides sp. TaxID=35761 RepID=UPI002C98828E|nr:C2 family cysteine protease [Nocardioides sp.]HXH80991.1 C2 family cysteine protease [Nocardioides sp.]